MFGVVYILIYISDQQYRNALLNYCHLKRAACASEQSTSIFNPKIQDFILFRSH